MLPRAVCGGRRLRFHPCLVVPGSDYNTGKSYMTQPNFKRRQPTILGQNSSGSNGNFGGSGSKVPLVARNRGNSKDVKKYFKGHVNSTSFDKNVKREKSSSDRNCDSWNRAKKRIFCL